MSDVVRRTASLLRTRGDSRLLGRHQTSHTLSGNLLLLCLFRSSKAPLDVREVEIRESLSLKV